jgi:hypothetical protein
MLKVNSEPFDVLTHVDARWLSEWRCECFECRTPFCMMQ